MSQRSNKRRQPRRFIPRLRRLEDRTVPAGNVIAVVNGGVLNVIGDGLDNQVWIAGDGYFRAIIRSIDGTTTINGQAGPVTLSGITRGYDIVMDSGNDTLALSGIHAWRSLSIDLGSGNNALHIVDSHSWRDTRIVAGGNNDGIQIVNSNFWRDSMIDPGDGNDIINLPGTTFWRRTWINGGPGINVLTRDTARFFGPSEIVNFTTTPIVPPPQQNPPIANNDTASVTRGGTVSINVAANDVAQTGTLNLASITIVSAPQNGTAVANANGTVTYTNNGSAATTDSFTYTIRDSAGNVSNVATVSITIQATNQATTTISSPISSPTRVNSIPFRVVFSKEVPNLPSSAIQITNGSVLDVVRLGTFSWQISVQGNADGPVSAFIPANAVQDVDGLGNLASNTFTIVLDRVAPVVTTNPLVTNDPTPTITGTIDDPTATITVDVEGQLVTATITGNTWSATLTTPLPDGTYDVLVTARDAAGNQSFGDLEAGLTIDTVAPTATITTTEPDPTSTSPIPFTVTFDEPVFGFSAAGITVTNGTVSNFVAVDETTYTFDVTPTTDGEVTVTVTAGAARDEAGNDSEEATFSITFTSGAPVATISTTATDPTNLSPIPFTITFNKDVFGFDVTDLIVTNGTISDFVQVDARTYTFNVTPDADGLVTVTLPAGAVQDDEGNGNLEATFSITSDRTAPDAPVIIGLDPDSDGGTLGDGLTNDNTPTIIGTAEPGTTIEVFADSGSGPVSLGTTVTDASGNWSFTPTTALADGSYTITATATDAAGNVSPTSAGFALTIDTVAPVATITTTEPDPTSANVIPFTVTFDKDVTGFTAAGITVGNGILQNFVAVDARTYTFDVVPLTNGLVTVTVNAGAATDAAGNTNAEVSFSISSDRFLATISTTAPDPTNLAVIPFTVVFTRDAIGFDETDLVVTNGTVSDFVQVDARTFTFNVTPIADGLVTIQIPAGAVQDPDGNPNVEATFSITSDRTAPDAPVITGLDPASDGGVLGDGITNVPAPTIIGTAEPGSTIEVFADSGSGPVSLGTTVTDAGGNWAFTPANDLGDGTYTITATATDAAGNVSAVSTGFTLTIDTVRPTTTITTTEPDPTSAATIPFTVVFSKDVTGFSLSGITVVNGTASNFVMVDARTYTFDVTPDGDGLVTVTVAAGAAADIAGNANEEASFTIRSERFSPTATITSSASDPTNQNPIPITVRFSEDVTGFDVTDIVVQNGTISNFTMVDARTYTFDVTPIADGLVTIKVLADSVQDAAGNGNPEANFAITYDSTPPSPPVVTGLDPDSDSGTLGDGVTNVTTPTLIGTAEAGATVTVFANSGSGANVLGTTVADAGGNWSFTVTSPLADGVYTITATATDAAGNVSAVSGSFTLTIDTAAPVPTITTTASSPTNLAVIVFRIEFTKEVTGLTLADFLVTNGTAANLVMLNPETYTIEVTPTGDGTVTVDLPAGAVQDFVGNASTSATISIVSDRTAPTGSINPTSSGAILGTANDASGIQSVVITIFDGSFYWDGNGFNSTTPVQLTVTTNDNFATWSYALPKVGTFTVTATITDLAGNVTTITQTVVLT